ncbi:MAG: transketolase C-terminal domain-containing protein, partial [Longimicrobiales bacterium]
GVEDLAVMRVLPGMTVLAPGDPMEARLATRAALLNPGPCYLRLGKAGEIAVHNAQPDFEIGRCIQLRDGTDATIISTGGVLPLAVAAAQALEKQGVRVRLLSMPCIEPLDVQAVERAARETQLIVTVEEHGPGGLSSAVAEVLACLGTGTRLVPVRLQRGALHVAGDQTQLRAAQGVSADGIAASVTGNLAVFV